MWPIATLCWKDFRGITGGFHWVGSQFSNRGWFEIFSNCVFWVVSSRNYIGNNGTNGKVGNNGACFNIGVGVWKRGLGYGFWVYTWGSGVWKDLTSVCHFYLLFYLCHYYLCHFYMRYFYLKSFWVSTSKLFPHVTDKAEFWCHPAPPIRMR